MLTSSDMPFEIAEKVILISSSTVNIISDPSKSSFDRIDRYFSSVYPVGVLAPLSTICTSNLPPQLRGKALAAFHTTSSCIEDIGKDFVLARKLLQKSQSVVEAVSKMYSAGTGPLDAFPDYRNYAVSGGSSILAVDSNLFRAETAHDDHTGGNALPTTDIGMVGSNALVSHFPTPLAGFDNHPQGELGWTDKDWLLTTW